MLPGNIHTDSIWDELGLDEAAEAAINAKTIPPLLIVMADGGLLAYNTSGGPASYEGMVLTELIPHIESRYCAWKDPAGRAIGGLATRHNLPASAATVPHSSTVSPGLTWTRNTPA